ncbi:hypothetical protein Krac_3492 [Ktedonobacter racemifer DSM 44963]|uniref:Uncharacterized protein n=1 Tax=Ktedonobacter racemifer DSM 44963 TaxID=485913 RepID=D6U1L3_KTERA|nr:hypothetical protein Krac_3492 [Ktedonobacter racemifer DSM 44963]
MHASIFTQGHEFPLQPGKHFFVVYVQNTCSKYRMRGGKCQGGNIPNHPIRHKRTRLYPHASR